MSIFVMLLFLVQTVFAASWPADTTAMELASGLGTYEPSGIVWHSRLNTLFLVSDPSTSFSGRITQMNTDGSGVTHWTIGGDLEGIAVADPSSNYVYVLNEYPYAIYEVDISTGTKTKSWDLSSVVPAPANTGYGLEGMTYIPSEDYATTSGRGVFVVGSQETGALYFLDIDTSTTDGYVTLLRSMTPSGAWLSDLFYDRETNVLYVLYDSLLVEMDLQGTPLATYTVPGSDQEGIALATTCSATTTTIYIAYDTPASVKGYANYPVTCPSSDDPGPTTAVWPASTSGINVGLGLSSSFEPSGVAWNAATDKLVVVNDNGGVSTMNADGSSVTSWSLSGDLEGVSASEGSITYVLNEYPFAIYAFDILSGTRTATWDLSSIGITTPSTTSNGLEGIAYIPNYGASSNVYAVGSSDDGRIYFIDVSSSGSATLLRSMRPAAEAMTDMYYSADTELLYVLYGTTLREMTLDGTVVTTYTSVPGTDPEGFTFVSDCAAGTAIVYIANDNGNTVMKYTGYPIICTDDIEMIDPNLISSYTIDTVNALVIVSYADGHSNTINPFTGTDQILVGLNYDNTVLVVTNGKRMKTYQNAVQKDNEYISKYIPSAMTLTITHGSSSDTVALQYTARSRTSTATFVLSGTTLVRT